MESFFIYKEMDKQWPWFVRRSEGYSLVCSLDYMMKMKRYYN